MNSKPRPCPVCGGLEREVLHQQRFYEGVLGDGYDVVVCNHCGAGFADGIPEQAELDRYYAEQSRYTYAASGGKESEYDIRRFEGIVDQVAPYISKDARILDVGCATGGLLSVFKRRGYTNVVGADPSPACAEAAKRLYDIEVRTSTVFELEHWTDQFDLVLLVGVLEHIREVHQALRALKSRLKPETGLLYIAVPDVEGFVTCRNAPFQQFSMEHVNFFSRECLTRVTSNVSLSVRAMGSYSMEWRQSVYEPIAFVITCGLLRTTLDATRDSLKHYARYSTCRDEQALEKIASLARSKVRLYVWGVGALTRRLLSRGLDNLCIVSFVDSGVTTNGMSLAGVPIVGPEKLMYTVEPILVCSVAFAAEITDLVRNKYRLSNPILNLYD